MAKASLPPRHLAPDRLTERLRQLPLYPALQENLRELKELFRDCSDLVVHEIAPRKGPAGCLLFIDGLVQKNLVDRDILLPLLQGEALSDLSQVSAGLTTLSEAKLQHTFGEVVGSILSGDAILLIDGTPGAISYGVKGWESRSVEEPLTEATIRGPREGFVETLRVNTSLLRRKIKSPALKMVPRKIGRITQTDVVVAYIEGIANPGVVQEVFARLERVDIDGVLEGGYLEELIQDSPFSPFPQVQNTERPDTAAAQLLEGRVAILVDGTPFVLVVPVVFAQFMQASEDYYERFLIGTAVRMLRYSLLFVALLFPSLYVAIITFHQEMLPTPLLITVAAAREGIPFPALIEALIMEVSFEIMREAGIRLPRPVGQAVSIVGALVIGQAAVEAGLASAPAIIIVSMTGIATFAIPRYNASIAIRLLRFPMMFLAGSLGLFGIATGLAALLLHLCSLRSFGIPYLSPLAPLDFSGLKDTTVRAPLWWLSRRPRFTNETNPIRLGRGQRPGPDPGQGR